MFGNYLKLAFRNIINYTRYENNSYFQSITIKYIPENGEAEKFFYESKFYLGDTSFLNIFDFPFVFGRADNAIQNEHSLVITSDISHKYFGDKNPVEALRYE